MYPRIVGRTVGNDVGEFGNDTLIVGIGEARWLIRKSLSQTEVEPTHEVLCPLCVT